LPCLRPPLRPLRRYRDQRAGCRRDRRAVPNSRRFEIRAAMGSIATVERSCQISLDVALKTGGLHCRHFHLASCPRSRRKFRSG
jgi:hypothetical protein